MRFPTIPRGLPYLLNGWRIVASESMWIRVPTTGNVGDLGTSHPGTAMFRSARFANQRLGRAGSTKAADLVAEVSSSDYVRVAVDQAQPLIAHASTSTLEGI